jgi:hypothetical protein
MMASHQDTQETNNRGHNQDVTWVIIISETLLDSSIT